MVMGTTSKWPPCRHPAGFEGALPEITAPVARGSRRTRPFIDMNTASPLVTRVL
jgi:hypothetical protein